MQLEAQVVPVVVHYHHGWLIWLLFLCGAALHVCLQINNLVTQAKSSWSRVFCVVWVAVAYRMFACAMIFGLIWQHPALISQIGGLFGHPLSGDESSVFAIPMNNMIAGLYGLYLDSVLGYVPWFKSQLPQVGS
jgi:hypothetical protein